MSQTAEVAANVVNVALLGLYLVAAYVRYRASVKITAIRRSYRLSVSIALIFAGSYVWLMIFGESPVRLLLLRTLQIVVLCNVWIWPALIALGLRERRPFDYTEFGISNAEADRK